MGHAAEGRPGLEREEIRKLPADYQRGRERDHGANGAIQCRQGSQPWFRSLVLQAGNRHIASLRD
jgi:hypothetical protein